MRAKWSTALRGRHQSFSTIGSSMLFLHYWPWKVKTLSQLGWYVQGIIILLLSLNCFPTQKVTMFNHYMSRMTTTQEPQPIGGRQVHSHQPSFLSWEMSMLIREQERLSKHGCQSGYTTRLKTKWPQFEPNLMLYLGTHGLGFSVLQSAPIEVSPTCSNISFSPSPKSNILEDYLCSAKSSDT